MWAVVDLKCFNLVKLELRFLGITFAAQFQGGMGHRRHSEHHLKCKGQPYSFYAWKFGVGYCVLLQLMHTVTDLQVYLTAVGQQLILELFQFSLSILLQFFQVLGQGMQPGQQQPGSLFLLVLLELFLHFPWFLVQVLISVMIPSPARHLQHEDGGWEAMRDWHRFQILLACSICPCLTLLYNHLAFKAICSADLRPST